MAISCITATFSIRPRLPASAYLPQSSKLGSRFSKTTAMSTSSATPTTTTPQKEREKDKEQQENIRTVINYHNQTKHSFQRYARGPGRLDWANQPNPFRRYEPAPTAELLHLPPDKTHNDFLPYPEIFKHFPTPAKPLDKASISQFFYDSLALSAWKSTGFSTWSLRVNPSSGNLHPTEGYIISGPVSGICDSPFLAHYAPKEHRLELRAEIPVDLWSELCNGFPENTFFVGLSSIFWREAWKYGERAFRYCNHDVGHAIGAVSVAAAVLGWDVRLIDELGHEQIEALLGLAGINGEEFIVPDQPIRGYIPQLEREHGDCLLAVFPAGEHELRINPKTLASVASRFAGLGYRGRPNALSMEHICWDIIYRAAKSSRKPISEKEFIGKISPLQNVEIFTQQSYKQFGAREVIRKRRSAVDMDSNVSIDKAIFYQILLKVLPYGLGEEQGGQRLLPFRALSWKANIHLVIFVHRVVGLQQGLYILVRNKDQFDSLKGSMKPDFLWVQPEGCPSGLSLFRLASHDCQNIAMQLSCCQDIAGNGCFSLGMLAQFKSTLYNEQAWMYPRLFWEAGLLGQVLYLEAHAVGISATGIGCYFDDPVHEVLGLTGNEFQSMYHFTVGGAVLDKRIMSLPAYPGPQVDA